jgi:transcriptional regulator with XRE-family HTH domain
MNRPAMLFDEAKMPAPVTHVRLPSLRAWRLQRELRQVDLATTAGVSKPVVERAERGQPVRALSAAKLARALGVTVQQLESEAPQ